MNRLLILKIITIGAMAAIIILGLYYFVYFDMTPVVHFTPPPGMHTATSLNATTSPPPTLNGTKFAAQPLNRSHRGSSI